MTVTRRHRALHLLGGTGTLPGGLTLNTTTGAITGTPTAAGTFTIQVKDANGVVATATCPFTIVRGAVAHLLGGKHAARWACRSTARP